MRTLFKVLAAAAFVFTAVWFFRPAAEAQGYRAGFSCTVSVGTSATRVTCHGTAGRPTGQRLGTTVGVASGGSTINCGGSNVTTTTGIPVAADEEMWFGGADGAVYCIIGAGTQDAQLNEAF